MGKKQKKEVVEQAALDLAEPERKPRPLSMAAALAGITPPPMSGKIKTVALQRLAVDIPADLHVKIKEYASRTGSTVREDISELLTWFYNRP